MCRLCRIHIKVLGFPTGHDAGGVVVRPHAVLLRAALHVLRVERLQVVDEASVVGVHADREVAPTAIEVELRLLLALQDVLLHGLLQELLDLVQEAGPQQVSQHN